MSRLVMRVALGLMGMALAGADVWACDGKPCPGPDRRSSGGRVVPGNAGPSQPLPGNTQGNAGRPANPGVDVVRGGDALDWDLPQDTKHGRAKDTGPRPDAAARSGQPANIRPPVSADRQGGSWNDRMVQAVNVQRTLVLLNARLEAKRAELQRWDEQAQEKFRRAFGTAQEEARQQVLGRIDQEIQRNNQLLAVLAQNVNFEFYLQTKNRK
jgi:hypothetical protein